MGIKSRTDNCKTVLKRRDCSTLASKIGTYIGICIGICIGIYIVFSISFFIGIGISKIFQDIALSFSCLL